ncbi:hypothetical protein D3C85_1034100 [compost metagenome]
METVDAALGAQGDLGGRALHRAVLIGVLGRDALFDKAVHVAVDPGYGGTRRQGDAAHVEPHPTLQTRAGRDAAGRACVNNRGQRGQARYVIEVVLGHARRRIDKDTARPPAAVEVEAEAIQIDV